MQSSESAFWSFGVIFLVVSVFTTFSIPTELSPGYCEFPPDIRGRWVRSRDKRTLIFSEYQVIGLAVRYQYQVMNRFKCYSRDGDDVIIYDTHDVDRKSILNYYMCWKLVSVSPHAYILYELTNLWNRPYYEENRNGYVQDAYSPVHGKNVCAINSTSVLFTTLYRYNAPLNDISSMCPESLLATFSYNACKKAELDFCSDRRTAVANYKICPLQFLKSESGNVKCMGFVRRGKELYLNMYSDGNVFCSKVPENREINGSIMLTVYTYDCSYITINASFSGNQYTTYALVERTSCPPLVKPLQLKDISSVVMLIIGGCMATALLLNFACYCKYRQRRDSETPEEMSQSSSLEDPKNSPRQEGSTSSVQTDQTTKSQTPPVKLTKLAKSPLKGPTTLFTKYKQSSVDSSAYSVTL